MKIMPAHLAIQKGSLEDTHAHISPPEKMKTKVNACHFLSTLLFAIATLITAGQAGITVSTLPMSPLGCLNVQLGGRSLWLEPSFELNHLVLFEPDALAHSRTSQNFDSVHMTDVLVLGDQPLVVFIEFSGQTAISGASDCDGALPLGQASGLWSLFSCMTFSGSYLYLGMPAPASAVSVTSLNINGVNDLVSLDVRLDMMTPLVTIPLATLSGGDLKVVAPFRLSLPWDTYETVHLSNDVVTLGRAFIWVASATICRGHGLINFSVNDAALIWENEQAIHEAELDAQAANQEQDTQDSAEKDAVVNMLERSFIQDANTSVLSASGSSNVIPLSLSVLPFKCRAESEGLQTLMHIIGFGIFILMICWFANKAEKWFSLKLGFAPARTLRGSLNFFASDYLLGSCSVKNFPHVKVMRQNAELPTGVRQDTGDGETQLLWLFLMSLLLWNTCFDMIAHGRAFCFLCPVTWICPANPLLPSTLAGQGQLFLVILAPILGLVCLSMLLSVRLFRPWSLTLVPVTQFGLATLWLVMVPLLGDMVEIMAWLLVTLMLNWAVTWDAIVLVEEAVHPTMNQDLRRAWHPKILALCVLTEAVMVQLASAVAVYGPLFDYYGPRDPTLYFMWMCFFSVVISTGMPFFLAVTVKLFAAPQ